MVGAGGYADNSVGGAAATGDGDVLVRFLPRSEKSVDNRKTSPMTYTEKYITNKDYYKSA